MSLGTYISVLGHAGVIGWVLVGQPFQTSEPDPMIETTEVSVISSEIFDIMLNNTPPDVGVIETAQPQAQALDDVPSFDIPIDDAPATADVSETDPPDRDILPTARPAPLVRPDTTALATPAAPSAPPVELAPSNPIETDVRPQPRPAPRVAPTAVAPPPPDVQIGDVLKDAAQPADAPPEETPKPEVEVEVAEAPEAANTEIVTEPEAEDTPASLAPTTSLRPQGRPANLRIAEADPEPEPTPEPTPEPEATPAVDPVTAALQAAIADSERAQAAADAATAAAAQQGLSVAESQGLTLAIQNCWNVGFLSSQALATTVVVGVDFTIDGRPIPSSLKLLARSGGSDASARQAFMAARRAILECGQTGFELPQNIYETWRTMELVFNPSSMRIK